MNEKLATFFGLLLSDGSIYYDKSKRTYCIQFTSKLDGLRNAFRTLVVECFGVENFHENRCKNAVSLRFFSVAIAKRLMSLSGISSKRYNKAVCNIPSFILKDKQLIAAFLRGFVSGDGSVYVNKRYSILRVEIACHYTNLRKQIADCLSLLEIPCRVTERSVVITSFENCFKFLSDVGFLEESLVSDSSSPKFGIAKNSLASLEFPAKLPI